MLTFNIAQHSSGTGQVVEVFDGKTFIATIYPNHDLRALKIISKHLSEIIPFDDMTVIVGLTSNKWEATRN